MKKLLFLFACLLSCLGLHAQNIENGTILFDSDWRFHLGGALSAEKPGFNDSDWRVLDLPHDWSIEDLPGTNSPFNPDAVSQVNGGFTTGGTGWYRKSFTIPPTQNTKRIIIQFDGIYMNPEIWINGVSLGSHPYGYTSFWFDITEYIKYDKPNIMAVKVRNEGENSRWYSGSGIYRHVWLKVLNPVHIAQWGIKISTPEVTATSAKVNIKTKVNNKTNGEIKVKLITKVLNLQGKLTAETGSEQIIEKESLFEFNQVTVIPNPELWSIDSPTLYKTVCEIYVADQKVDQVETNFGIRTLSFDNEKGFQLNGKSSKLKGGCIHHDHGPLGAKSYDRAEERRVELMKANGFNAIRCSHNPPAPALLDACDRLGMLVIDEAFDMWLDGKNANDYHNWFEKWWQKDIESMINRDINHPSIILWSIGNEIPGMNTPEVAKTAQIISDFVKTIDHTRPVTAAVNVFGTETDPFFATLNVSGYNYGAGIGNQKNSLFDIDHERIASRIMVQTESYPLDAFQSWMAVIDKPWLIGDFVWTAVDYIGEASIGWRGYFQESNFYPWNLAWCGDIDVCGWKRPQSYYRDVLWNENQLSVFVKPPKPSFPENLKRESWSKWHWHDVVPSWNWQKSELKPMDVTVYSSCEQVELQLNGKSLGKKSTNRNNEYTATWQVPFEPGSLEAIGYTGNKRVKTTALKTAGEVSQIKLTADRSEIKANNQDLVYITVELTDDKGVLNPTAENLVKFEMQGTGTIVGVGNGNPVSLESFQLPQRKAWRGRCQVIIKSDEQPGEIILKASVADLPSGEIKFHSILK